jgi:hypothetical protein
MVRKVSEFALILMIVRIHVLLGSLIPQISTKCREFHTHFVYNAQNTLLNWLSSGELKDVDTYQVTCRALNWQCFSGESFSWDGCAIRGYEDVGRHCIFLSFTTSRQEHGDATERMQR